MPIIQDSEGPILQVFQNEGGTITIKDVLWSEEAAMFREEMHFITVHPDDIPELIVRLQEVAAEIKNV